jgi:transposase InsO family protein/transposase-like protein
VTTSHVSRKSNGVSKSDSRGGKRERVPARSRRFSPAEHARALSLMLDGINREQVAKTIGCTTESLRRWYAEGKKQGLVTKLSEHERKGGDRSAATKPAVAEAAATSAPQDPGAGLGEHEVKAILHYKKKHPSMGPAQIRAQLKRFLGWRVSVKAIARVLRKAGYALVHRKGRPVGDEHPRRFEAPHRNSLWQLDLTELRVGSERRWLLVIEDDFSRFVVGHVLAEGPTSEVVVAAMREALRLHGKPERVYTDRGAAFTAWRDVTSCEQFLDEQLIDHSLRKAHRPQGGGKIESVIGTVQRELWEVVHFDDVGEAERALATFFADYNHRRAHLGIGSLVPADRFYGRWPEVIAEMDAISRRRQGALALQLDRRLFVEPPAAGERVVALQLILVGDQAELHLGGRRVVLGRVEP